MRNCDIFIFWLRTPVVMIMEKMLERGTEHSLQLLKGSLSNAIYCLCFNQPVCQVCMGMAYLAHYNSQVSGVLVSIYQTCIYACVFVYRMVEDLHKLLTVSSSQPKPFLLVSSDFTTLVSRFYAQLYEQQVNLHLMQSVPLDATHTTTLHTQ